MWLSASPRHLYWSFSPSTLVEKSWITKEAPLIFFPRSSLRSSCTLAAPRSLFYSHLLVFYDFLPLDLAEELTAVSTSCASSDAGPYVPELATSPYELEVLLTPPPHFNLSPGRISPPFLSLFFVFSSEVLLDCWSRPPWWILSLEGVTSLFLKSSCLLLHPFEKNSNDPLFSILPEVSIHYRLRTSKEKIPRLARTPSPPCRTPEVAIF